MECVENINKSAHEVESLGFVFIDLVRQEVLGRQLGRRGYP